MASPDLDIVLSVSARNGESVWQISCHPESPLGPPRWTAALTRNTPTEIVADTLNHLAELEERDRDAALWGPANLRALFDSVGRAGWTEAEYDGLVCATAPEIGSESLELAHIRSDAWRPDAMPGNASTILTAGWHEPFGDQGDHVWRAEFSRHAPAHLVTALLTAATAPLPALRHPDAIPRAHRAALTCSRPLGSEAGAPSVPASVEPPTALAQISHWRCTEDGVGGLVLHSPCGRVSVAHTPQDRLSSAWASSWTFSATGDDVAPEGGGNQLGSWRARFTARTPVPVLAAATAALARALEDLDSIEVWYDFETSAEPSFTAHRRYRPDPVPGSRDPALAHAQLRLLGWEKTDGHSARSSSSPGGVELWSVHRGEPSSLDLIPPPEAWTLDGGQPPELWTATFDPGTPTFLVVAAAQEAARLAQPASAGPITQLSQVATRFQVAHATSVKPRTAADPVVPPTTALTGRRGHPR